MKRITRVLEGRDGKDVYAGTGVSEAGLTGLAHAERKDIDLATTETGKPPLDMSSLIKSTIKAIWGLTIEAKPGSRVSYRDIMWHIHPSTGLVVEVTRGSQVHTLRTVALQIPVGHIFHSAQKGFDPLSINSVELENIGIHPKGIN